MLDFRTVLPPAPPAPRTSPHEPRIRESQGNGTLLILVDTAQPECLHVPATLFAALEHFGMPYRLRDLGAGRLRAEELEAHRALIVAQAVSGIEVGTDKAWKYADELKLPRAVFITRIKKEDWEVVEYLRANKSDRLKELKKLAKAKKKG